MNDVIAALESDIQQLKDTEKRLLEQSAVYEKEAVRMKKDSAHTCARRCEFERAVARLKAP